MKKIALLIKSQNLGELVEKDGKYLFFANNVGVLESEKENFVAMKLFGLNRSGVKEYDSLPFVFSVFLPSDSRTDLNKKAGIDAGDSDFEKLYKIAALEIKCMNFEIRQS